MRMLPDTILFSRMAPAGISIRSPWLAMMMTVPYENKRKKLAFESRNPKTIETHAQGNTTTEGDITAHGQVIQLDDVRDVGETAQELLHLGEMVLAQLDQRRGGEHALGRHHQAAVLQGVQIRHDQQQIGRLLHGQETGAGHIDTDGAIEALHGRTHSSLQLNDTCSILQRLVVHDDLHVQGALTQNAINC